MENIHIRHLGTFDEDFFKDLNEKFNHLNIEISHNDTNGEMYNSLDSYFFQFIVDITNILMPTWKEISGNAKWDAIKYIVKLVWDKTRGQTYSQITSSGATTEKITKLCLQMDTFKFSLEGFPEDKFNELCEKAYELYERSLKHLPNGQRSELLVFDEKTNDWIIYNG